jgi:hypothetical protein
MSTVTMTSKMMATLTTRPIMISMTMKIKNPTTRTTKFASKMQTPKATQTQSQTTIATVISSSTQTLTMMLMPRAN